MSAKPFISHCPECDAVIQLDDVVKGDIIVCPDCAVELKVISLEPPVLSPAPLEEED